jgi:hypothetical protein
MNYRVILAVIALFVVGCSDRSSENWYDQSANATIHRDEFIADQAALGVDPDQARAAHDLKQFTIRTEGRNMSVVLEGEDLERTLNQP